MSADVSGRLDTVGLTERYLRLEDIQLRRIPLCPPYRHPTAEISWRFE